MVAVQSSAKIVDQCDGQHPVDAIHFHSWQVLPAVQLLHHKTQDSARDADIFCRVEAKIAEQGGCQ
ncbi:MAG: hypothetical protein ACK47M_21825, partial [Caldilinea sp.]